MWSKKYCDSTSEKLGDIFGEYIEYINFHMIPANVLMKDIRPLDIVPVHIIMNALAYQVKYTIAFSIFVPYFSILFFKAFIIL